MATRYLLDTNALTVIPTNDLGIAAVTRSQRNTGHSRPHFGRNDARRDSLAHLDAAGRSRRTRWTGGKRELSRPELLCWTVLV